MSRPLRLTLLTGCIVLGLLHTPAAWDAAREARSGPAESGLVRLPRPAIGFTVAAAPGLGAARDEATRSVPGEER